MPFGNYGQELPYIFANGLSDKSEIVYDGKIYFVEPKGRDTKVLIEKKIINDIKVDKRKMKGVKIK